MLSSFSVLSFRAGNPDAGQLVAKGRTDDERSKPWRPLQIAGVGNETSISMSACVFCVKNGRGGMVSL